MSSKDRQTKSKPQSNGLDASAQQVLPDKIDTLKVIEMIRNADLYDLINISLRSNELKNESVEAFIQKALDKGGNISSRKQALAGQENQKQQSGLDLIFTPPSKLQLRQQQLQSSSSPQQQNQNSQQDENNNIFVFQNLHTPMILKPSQFQKPRLQQPPLQPSMLENSSTINHQHQLALSYKQLEEFQQLLQQRLSQDAACSEYQQPRDTVPQPYSEHPTSPVNDNTDMMNQTFSEDQCQLGNEPNAQLESESHIDASDQRQSSSQRQGEQFSFRMRGSHLKQQTEEEEELNSQLSESNLKTRQSHSKNNLQAKRGYKMGQQKHQIQLETQQQPLNRTLSNFRAFNQQLTLNRSTSSNALSLQGQQDTPSLSTSKINNFELKTPRPINSGSFTARRLNQEASESNLQVLTDQRRNLDLKKQRLLASYHQINIKHIIELERIKKPSQLAYVTGRLVCQFFSIFKDIQMNNPKPLHMEDLIEWDDIQKHINSQIIKYTNELLNTIKQKVILQGEFVSTYHKDFLEMRLTHLRQDYFTGDNMKLFKHLSTNKTLQAIVTFIYNVISYFLENQESERQSDSVIVEEQHLEEIQESEQKNKSRNIFKFNQDTTLTDRSPMNKSQLVSSDQPQAKLQKSASRCLLQRRDRSQLLQRQEPYTSNKSPINASKATKDASIANQKERNPSRSQSRLNKNGVSNTKSPLSANRKAFRPERAAKDSANNQGGVTVKERLSEKNQVPSEHHEQRLSCSTSSSMLIMPIDFNQDLNTEKPVDLNYKLMIESSGFSQMIRDTTALIELNMKKSPQKKQIDMGLIEQIKQRRKDQIEREMSEGRSATSRLMAAKKIAEQL